MKSKVIQFLEEHQSGERSTFVDDAKWRQENASWLKQSQRVDEFHIKDDFINRRTTWTGIILHLADFNGQKREIVTS